MEIRLRLILTVYIVNFALVFIKSQEEPVHKLQNLLDSIIRNDTKQEEFYIKMLNQEVNKKQHDFDGMKKELLIMQHRHSYKNRNFVQMDTSQNILAAKREINEKNHSTDATTLVNAPINPDTFYREILQRAIELMWSQEAHLIRMKVRESSIRRKSKQSVIEMQDIITDTDMLYKDEIDILADRFWTPKPDQRHKIPILPEIIEHFMKNWKKFEDLVETDLKMRPNVETDCDEIKEEMRKAQINLQAGYEEIKEQMKIYEEMRNRARKSKKQPA